MKVIPIKTGVFKERADLLPFIFKHVKKIPDKSILVVTSKIVSVAEGRVMELGSQSEKTKLIKKESDFFLKGNNGLFTIKDGIVMAFAGIDESNANGKMILLPKDSYKSAHILRNKIIRKLKIKNLGVLITDSEFLPLRVGALGVALGYAGFAGTKNYIGQKDIFGRKLKMSKTNIADGLAASAVLCMGEGNERQPLALITDAPVVFANKVKKNEMKINPKQDIYAPLFNKIS
jgi:coenzyme F420-0:L-glutamate ligase